MVTDIMMMSSSSSGDDTNNNNEMHQQQQQRDENDDDKNKVGGHHSNNNNIQNILLPDVCWQYILSYLTPNELCCMALVTKHEFYQWSIHDRYWKSHCLNRWKGKQLGIMHHVTTTTTTTTPVTTTPVITTTTPVSNLSWKQRYAWMEYDKYRTSITHDEISYYYQWKLIYNGSESTLGLRQFKSNGTYDSPYMGRCYWSLSNNNNKFNVMNMSLSIERDPITWGWIIGKGSNTVYYSVERKRKESER